MIVRVSNLQPGQQYYVQIRGKGSDVLTEWSHTYTMWTNMDSIPCDPITDLAGDFSSSSLTLKWTGINLGKSINKDFNHYLVELTNGVDTRTFITKSTYFELTFDDNINAFGTPRPSFAVSVSTVDNTGNINTVGPTEIVNPVPTTVSGFEAKSGIDSIFLEWDGHEHSDISKYVLYRSTDSGFTPNETNRLYQGRELFYVDILSSEMIQYYKLKAVDVFGQESGYVVTSETPSPPFELDTSPPDPLDIDSLVTSLDPGDPSGRISRIVVNWTPLDLSLGNNEQLRGYKIRIKPTSSSYWEVFDAPDDHDNRTSSFIINSLQPDVDYEVQIASYGSFGTMSEWSDSALTTSAKDDVAPEQPSSITVVPGPTFVSIAWSEVSDSDVIVSRGFYEVEVHDNDSFSSLVKSQKAFATNASIGGLTSGEEYWVRVRAVDATGNEGTWKTSSSVTLTQTITPFDLTSNFALVDQLLRVGNGSKVIQLDDDNTHGSRIFIGEPALAAGSGYRDSGVPFYADEDGRLSLGDKLSFDGSSLVVTGTIDALGGAFRDSVVLNGVSRTVSNKALTSNVATLTTSTNHGFSVGWRVSVIGVGFPFDGSYKITAVTSNTFSYARTAANVTSVSANGSATSGSMNLGVDAGGTGSHGLSINANNYWYSNGNFSVGNSSTQQLTWDGTTLDIKGNLLAEMGTIGGWNIANDSIHIGEDESYVALHSSDTPGDPFIWAGDEDAGDAKFRVSNTGILRATNALISGTIEGGAKIFIGDGFFKNSNTPFYVDAGTPEEPSTAGQFSLGNMVYYDPSIPEFVATGRFRTAESGNRVEITSSGGVGKIESFASNELYPGGFESGLFPKTYINCEWSRTSNVVNIWIRNATLSNVSVGDTIRVQRGSSYGVSAPVNETAIVTSVINHVSGGINVQYSQTGSNIATQQGVRVSVISRVDDPGSGRNLTSYRTYFRGASNAANNRELIIQNINEETDPGLSIRNMDVVINSPNPSLRLSRTVSGTTFPDNNTEGDTFYATSLGSSVVGGIGSMRWTGQAAFGVETTGRDVSIYVANGDGNYIYSSHSLNVDTLGAFSASPETNVWLNGTSLYSPNTYYDSASSTPSIYITTGGRFRRNSSTQKIKEQIVEVGEATLSNLVEEDRLLEGNDGDQNIISVIREPVNPEVLYDISPVSFVSQLDNDEDCSRLGFIAEDVFEKFPQGTPTDINGKPDGIEYNQITAGLVALVQKQKVVIDDLSDRIIALEEQLNVVE